MSSVHSGLEILHQKEGLITETECGRIGGIRYYGKHEAVAQIILAKGISESLKFCEIFEQYQLLSRENMKQIKGVSVYDLCIIYFKFVQFSMKW